MIIPVALTKREVASCALRTLGHTSLRVLSSMKTSVFTLLGLFVLTWLGTLHQIEHGLFQAQQKYFESWFLLQHPGDLFVGPDEPEWITNLPFSIPLPGGLTLMALLGFNLVVGGGFRIVQSMRSGARMTQRIGVLTTHLGMLVLLASGLVKTVTGIEGSVTLFEGESTQSFQSFHEWELAVQRQESDGVLDEMAVAGSEFLDLGRGEELRCVSDRLPFEVVVEGALRHCEPVPLGHGATSRGYGLRELSIRTENASNVAGCRITVKGDGVRGGELRGNLWGGDRAPFTVALEDGRVYGLRLRKRTEPLPFAMRLEDFEVVFHPGTRKPKSFESEVTIFEDEASPRRVRIEMNEPLRSGDLVVYQSSWGPQTARPGDPLFSGFQVVVNPADQWPLWGCLITAAGMILAFGARLLRFMQKEGKAQKASKAVAPTVALLLAVAGFGGAASAQQPGPGDDTPQLRQHEWSEDTLDRVRALPVQSDGRVKPLLTEVGYLLLRCNGTRELRVPDEERFGVAAGQTLTPIEWALDVMLFPAQADRYPVFLVQSAEVLDTIELSRDGKKKRDRYSFEELRPGLPKLFELSSEYGHIDEKERTGLQEQVVGLARNVTDYDRLIRTFDTSRRVFRLGGSPLLQQMVAPYFGGGVRQGLLYSEVCLIRPQLLALVPTLREGDPDEADARRLVQMMLQQADSLAHDQGLLRWLPPSSEEGSWLRTTDLWHLPEGMEAPDESALMAQALHEQLLRERNDEGAFTETLGRIENLVDERLAARGEGASLHGEVDYLKADPTFRALLWFVAAFVLVTFSWFKPKSRWLAVPAWSTTAIGLGVLVHGIAWRCFLRDRPPITGLYDTILFVAGTCVITALVVEWFHKRKVFLSLAAFLGMLGMFLARRFEAIDGHDTMPTLVAVLDTNFWLATHVTIINLGYAGTLLAGFIAHLFVVGSALGFREKHRPFFESVARATYGTVCFATLFTTVGTILGGIWANDSWGRFWGWDPKENGALMIVLWNVAMLHMRMGGMVKQLGFALMAVAGNAVVIFSWFHTNLLGVGLHSYGFASGLHTAVWTFYAVEAAVIAVGLWPLLRSRRALRSSV
ncbi:MAG: cytochrome c biogenesis protein ResB [Planctomycetota bacterium]